MIEACPAVVPNDIILSSLAPIVPKSTVRTEVVNGPGGSASGTSSDANRDTYERIRTDHCERVSMGHDHRGKYGPQSPVLLSDFCKWDLVQARFLVDVWNKL